jgi:hypothetical protein
MSINWPYFTCVPYFYYASFLALLASPPASLTFTSLASLTFTSHTSLASLSPASPTPLASLSFTYLTFLSSVTLTSLAFLTFLRSFKIFFCLLNSV